MRVDGTDHLQVADDTCRRTRRSNFEVQPILLYISNFFN